MSLAFYGFALKNALLGKGGGWVSVLVSLVVSVQLILTALISEIQRLWLTCS